jgi:hypothetical protein
MFRHYPALLCIQTGYDPGTLETALRELESTPTSAAGRWIEREGVVVWIRNGLRYDPNIRLADPKHRKGVERAIAALPRLPIVLRFCDYYRITRPFQDPTETLARPSEDQEGSGAPRPRPRPRPKNLETEVVEPVDGVDNMLAARSDRASIRSALALDSEGHQRTEGEVGTDGQPQRRGLTAEEDRARLEALTAELAREKAAPKRTRG